MQRHRFDPLSFVFGAVLALVAVVGLTDVVTLRLVDLRWAGPALLVLLGLVLVLNAGRQLDRHPDGPHDDDADTDLDTDPDLDVDADAGQNGG